MAHEFLDKPEFESSPLATFSEVPGALIIPNNFTPDSPPASYPMGHTMMLNESPGPWGVAGGYIEQVRMTDIMFQFFRRASDLGDEVRAFRGGAWTPWTHVGSSQFSDILHGHEDYLTRSAAASGYAPAFSPFVNMMPDSGRYFGNINPLALQSAAAFTNSPFFTVFNGTAASNAGKFIHNNTTNGGTAGVLTPSVSTLLAAMNRVDAAARYGVEFYVAQYVLGTGVSSPGAFPDGVTRYLMTINGDRAIFGFDAFATFSAWMRCTSGSIGVKSNNGTIWLDGVDIGSGFPGTDLRLFPADGWHHVRFQWSSPLGYNSAFPFIHGSGNGAAFQMAVPAIFVGKVNPGIHTAPLPSVNSSLA